MNRNYIVSDDILIYSIGKAYNINPSYVCVCETKGVGQHVSSGKRCPRVVRSSWAEEKQPKTINRIGSKGLYVYIHTIIIIIIHVSTTPTYIIIYNIYKTYSYIVHVESIIQCRTCVYFFRDRLKPIHEHLFCHCYSFSPLAFYGLPEIYRVYLVRD